MKPLNIQVLNRKLFIFVQETLKAFDKNSLDLKIAKPLKKLVKSRTIGENLNRYIGKCVLIGWKMATQTPRLYFKLFRTGEGNPFNSTVQEEFPGSPLAEGNSFEYYVFPVVMIEPNKLLVKGKLMFKQKPDK